MPMAIKKILHSAVNHEICKAVTLQVFRIIGTVIRNYKIY